MKTLNEILERNKAKQKSDAELDKKVKAPEDDNKAGKEDEVPAGGKTLTGQQHNEIDLEPTILKPIKESVGRKVVLTFGRMNPPTVGHQKLVEAVLRMAKEIGGKPMVFLSKVQDKKKNPIPYAHKLHYAQEAFGNVVKPLPKNAASVIDILRELDGKYDQVCMVVGSDRVPEFKKLLEKYNGHEYNFDRLDVVSAGERDPDAEGVEGMSASKLREAAISGNFRAFKKGLPHALQPLANDIYRDVRLEELELEGEELNESLDAQQRMKRAIQFRRIKTRVEAGRKRALRRRASKGALVKRSRRTAIKFMRKRLTRGTSYKDMSYGQRAQVDKALARRRKSIGRIAQRLLPKITRAEATRKLGSNFKGISGRVNEENLFDIVEQTLLMIAEEHDYMFTALEQEVLEAKAEEADLPFDVVERVYRRGIATWELIESDLTFQQYAFNRVNSFINGGAAYDMDFDLLDEDASTDPENEPEDGHLDNYEDDKKQTDKATSVSNPITHRVNARPGKHRFAIIKQKIIDEGYHLSEAEKKKADKPKPGELNKATLDKYVTTAEREFNKADNVRAVEAIQDLHKIRATSPNKLVTGIKPHLDHIKKLTGFVAGSNKKPELQEETFEHHDAKAKEHVEIYQHYQNLLKKERKHDRRAMFKHQIAHHQEEARSHRVAANMAARKKVNEDVMTGEKRRIDMPQLTDFHAFKKDLEDAGHKMTDESRKPADLEPSQKHFNQEKVDRLISSGAHKDKPIIVSHDDQIVDGHHRWEACRQAGCDVKTRKTSMKADELFDFVKGKPYVEKKGLNEAMLPGADRHFSLAQKEKLLANKNKEDPVKFHGHMAQHYSHMADWSRAKGRHNVAHGHDSRSEQHLDSMHKALNESHIYTPQHIIDAHKKEAEKRGLKLTKVGHYSDDQGITSKTHRGSVFSTEHTNGQYHHEEGM